jgi:Putative Ig domain
VSVTVNNTSMASAGTGGALSVTVSTKDGNGIAPGDTIIAYTVSNGTHAASVTVQDSINGTSFTQDKEQQIGATGIYAQASRYVVVNAVPDGATITLTPFASATITSLAVTVWRYSLGTIAQAYVSQSNAASTTQNAPALGAAPNRGHIIMTFDAAVSLGTLTPGGAFAGNLDSAVSASGVSIANAWAVADGTSTFASSWTDTVSQASATMTVAYTSASVGAPYLIARAAAAAGATTLVATVGAPVGAASVSGDALYAAVFLPNNTNAPTTITDSKAHTWTQRGNVPAPNGMSVYFYESLNATTTLVGADTITATFTNTLLGRGMFVFGCAGMNHTADLDPTSPDSSYGSGTAVSMSTGTDQLANNNELIVGLIAAGSKAGSVTWPSDWTVIGPAFQVTTGGIWMALAVKIVYSSNPVTVGPTLGASAVWAGLLLALTPDPPTGAAASVQITDGSPLPGATEGVQYQFQFHATGGAPGYTWTESGPMPSGLTLTAGTASGSGPISHVGANGGPDGTAGQALSDFDAAQTAIGGGNLTAIKLFYNDDLPADWSGNAGGTNIQAVVQKYPKVVPIIAWNGPNKTASVPPPSSPATIAKFCSSIPSGQMVIFAWQQEPENSSSGISAKGYTDGMKVTADAIHSLHRPELIVCHNAVWGGYMPTGAGTTGNYIPPPFDGANGVVDYYAIDVYQHQAGGSFNGATTWPTNGLANHSGFQNWLTRVKKLADPLGIPLGINEYGVDDTGSVAARNARIQLDYNYLKAHCGPAGDGAISAQSLLVLLYWWHNMAGANTHYKFTDSATQTLWKAAAAAAAASGGSTNGGLLSGIPGPASAGTYAAISITAHDSNGATGSKTFSLMVASPSGLAFDSTSPLPGATVGALYSYQFLGHGGKAPLTFALHAGSTLPTGWSLSAAGVLSGITNVAGTASFNVDLTDATPNTVTAPFTVLISTGLSISNGSLPNGTAGTFYTVTLATAGGTGPFAWGLAADSGALPPGLAIDPTLGTISGTATVPGAYPLDLQVTDAGGATATKQLTLTIAQSTGGLPPIGRRRFGGSVGDWVFAFVGDVVDRAAGVTVIFFNALTGGSQVTDLTTVLGAPITSITTDSQGEIPEFYGPDSVVELYADANGGLGPRRRMMAVDMGDLLVTLYGVVQKQTG